MSMMDKITFSNDTTAYVPGANLSLARDSLQVQEIKTLDILLEDIIQVVLKINTDKLTYASDTTALTPGARLEWYKIYHGGVANLSAAYSSGGSPYTSNTEKITFSDDTRSAVPSATMPAPRSQLGAAADRTAAYYVGGYNPSTTRDTNVDKMTFSTETMEALPSSADIGTQTDLMAWSCC